MGKGIIYDLIKFVINSNEELTNKLQHKDEIADLYYKGYVDALKMVNEELEKVLKISGGKNDTRRDSIPTLM